MKTTQIAQKAEGAMADGARTARSRLEDRLSQQSGPSAEQARRMAQDVNAVGEELTKRGRERPARMVSAAAGRAEQVGDYLERADGSQMIDDFSRYGREHPGMIGLAGFTAGFLAARFLKAGSGATTTSSSGSGGGQGAEFAGAPVGTPGGAEARPSGAPAAGGHSASGAPSGGR